MSPIAFSIERVNRLRRAAEKAREIAFDDIGFSGGTRVFTDYAIRLLDVFDTLWLKPGFVLYAFAHREFHGGNGRIWAVPADATPLVSGEGPSFFGDEWMQPPPGGVALMQAIEGDRSPWSYLSASILSREANEFGAWWHGCDWSVHTIISTAPRQADESDVSDDDWELTGEAPAGNWIWRAPVPRIWVPTYSEIGETKAVVLHIRNPIRRETIYRATDTYPDGSYGASTETELLCAGAGGIVF